MNPKVKYVWKKDKICRQFCLVIGYSETPDYLMTITRRLDLNSWNENQPPDGANVNV